MSDGVWAAQIRQASLRGKYKHVQDFSSFSTYIIYAASKASQEAAAFLTPHLLRIGSNISPEFHIQPSPSVVNLISLF